MEYSGPSSLKGREQAPSPATVIMSSPGQAAFASPQISMLVYASKIMLCIRDLCIGYALSCRCIYMLQCNMYMYMYNVACICTYI